MNNLKHSEPSPPETAGTSRSGDVPIKRHISSDELMAGRRELIIEHNKEDYCLRITSKGKLILTK